MSSDHAQILAEVTGRTLEQLAFIFSFADDDESEALEDSAVTGCGVLFKGPVSGQLLITISDAALPELAANMLGMEADDDIALEQQHDALRETLNVICGNLLPQLWGRESVFDIRPPAILASQDVQSRLAAFNTPQAAVASTRLSLDEGVCQVFLRVDP